MIVNKKNIQNITALNDGIAYIGKINNITNSYGKKIGEKFTAVGKLFFKYMYVRAEDVFRFSTFNTDRNLKVKTLQPPYLIESNSKISIKEKIYDITYVDQDLKGYTYLYLERSDLHYTDQYTD